MPTIKIDGVEYEVEAGDNILQTCLNLGLDLPYFCWHPAMGSVGACRQCALVQYQREEDSHGRIVMGCMTPVTDGAIFSLSGPDAQEFRGAIVESLMLNHPHDCPVCAEGGECHLQDMTVMVGHRDRHYRGKKNTHRNQYLGPLIHHEMNRCITCYRCTRYYREYAGGTDLAAMAAHDHIYFGRHEEGVLTSEFAGNLVEVCPTGVFTDKSLVNAYTRKWDLQSAPSVCTGCALGCNTLPGERYGKLKRIHNRFNSEVNGYFLCDRGRFGGLFVNSEQRLDYPGQRSGDGLFSAIHSNAALAIAGTAVTGKRLAGIGSPRASLESNYALQQLVGEANFCAGMADSEAVLSRRIVRHLCNTSVSNPSLLQVETADAVLVLGEDVTHTAPRLALALRQSVRNKGFAMAADLQLERWQDAAVRNLAQDERSPLHIAAFGSTSLDDIAASTSSMPIADLAHFAERIAAALAGNGSADDIASRIAADLQGAQRPLVVCGSSSASAALVDAARRIAEALQAEECEPMLSYCLPEANTMGSTLLTLEQGQSLSALAARAERGEIDTLLVVENDLFRRAPAALVEQLVDNVPMVIGLDILENATLNLCDLVLPATSFSESEATLVSSEGRAQRSFPVHVPRNERLQSWQWILSLAADHPALGPLEHFDTLTHSCAGHHPLLAGIVSAAPEHDFRSRGLKIPRQPHRYSGRTAMRADISVHEPKQTVDEESALAFTMEGNSSERPGSLMPFVWSPGWNSNQSVHKFQSEVGGPLKGGTAGVRLLEQAPILAEAAAAERPEAFQKDSELWLLQPRFRLFGSDELSTLTPAIAELAGEAWLELTSADAGRLGVAAGDGVEVGTTTLAVRIDDSIPAGCVGFSAGFPGVEKLHVGEKVSLRKAADWQSGQAQLIGSDRQTTTGGADD